MRYPNSTVHRISELLSVSDGNSGTIFVFVSGRKYPYSYPYPNYPRIIRSERFIMKGATNATVDSMV
uniref:Uncharacterized protein n=1 Tax=Oryza sativa subsp. japonica TaxID=39947 RepID=Q10H07_ORYSJ|nr:hypothetical protein LOC_Os03g41019 [Oryza sativa Japonica Group]